MPSEVKQLLFLVSVPLLLYLSKLSLTATRGLVALLSCYAWSAVL